MSGEGREGRMLDDINAFLTEIETVRPKSKATKLANVRKEHEKLQSVINSFNGKVGSMVDKQRSEYMQAYEHHMQDVQRELHLLRNKVLDIANDKTREDKLSTLASEEQFFKTEALTFDVETNNMRKRLRRLTSTMQSVERERDWLLKKLRETKKKYSHLQEERLRTLNTEDDNSSQNSSMSYILEIQSQNKASKLKPLTMKGQEKKSNLRSTNLLSAAPHLGISNDSLDHNRNFTTDAFLSSDNEFTLRGMDDTHELNSETGKLQQLNHHNDAEIRAEKRALGNLVRARARQEALHDLVDRCSKSCGKGAFAKIQRRSLPDLLAACMVLIESTSENMVNAEQRASLARELAATPETYIALADMLQSGSSSTIWMLEQTPHHYGSIDSNQRSSFDLNGKWADLETLPYELIPSQDDIGNG